MQKLYCVYIMTNVGNMVLYTGVTGDLERRVVEHKEGRGSTFTSRYKAVKLVYYECTSDVRSALEREKQIKAGSRKKKIVMIESVNPGWNDLFGEL